MRITLKDSKFNSLATLGILALHFVPPSAEALKRELQSVKFAHGSVRRRGPLTCASMRGIQNMLTGVMLYHYRMVHDSTEN